MDLAYTVAKACDGVYKVVVDLACNGMHRRTVDLPSIL